MKLRLLFSMLLCSLLMGVGQAQQQSIGLIGTATANDWNSDTNLVQNVDSVHLWSLKLNLKVGEAKFRQNDAWDVNWGDKAFPSGVGTQGGPNIPVPAAGEWTVSFNSITGAYNFAYTSDIGIIGDATPTGWGSDTKMYYDPADPDSNQYFITLQLGAGGVKFRANSDWAVNWGAADFPSGIGTQNGANIPIATAGKYNIKFNKATGAYSFEEVVEYTAISVIGSAVGGWSDADDKNLTKDNGNPNLWKGNITCVEGEVKFRANHAWSQNWGDTLFPSGIGILNGPNIKVPAGEYLVTFNTESFEYHFLPIVIYNTVGIIGDATPGGWNDDTDMIKDATNPSLWTLRIVLTTGEAKFRAENDWAVNWGAGDFPTGVATQDGANIPVPEGEYNITFNSITGEYHFEKLIVYNSIGLIGTATPNGNWDTDIDMTKDATDESFWYINSIDMQEGKAKFRVDDAWAINWGGPTFPTGIGTQDGPDILIPAGTYRVTLNSLTGAYAFLPPASVTGELLSANSIQLSPNPATDKLNIEILAPELAGDVTVKVFNSLGAQVMTQQINVQKVASVDVSRLTAGNYFIQMSNGKYLIGKPLVIAR